jgi:hypothetical protein
MGDSFEQCFSDVWAQSAHTGASRQPMAGAAFHELARAFAVLYRVMPGLERALARTR